MLKKEAKKEFLIRRREFLVWKVLKFFEHSSYHPHHCERYHQKLERRRALLPTWITFASLTFGWKRKCTMLARRWVGMSFWIQVKTSNFEVRRFFSISITELFSCPHYSPFFLFSKLLSLNVTQRGKVCHNSGVKIKVTLTRTLFDSFSFLPFFAS